MKIALIGASGFVGSRLLSLLETENGFELLNIDKNQSHYYPDITVKVNILDKKKLIYILKNIDIIILLAAEHRDDVSPISLYYDVNVQGLRNVLEAMEVNGIKRIIFTSSVAVYGLNKQNPNEENSVDPFNHYGKSKWQAEQVLQKWYKIHPDWNINIIRPTVIFGERNRGNVYNLLKQISSGRFLMVGNGNNKKSMAYVGNVVAFIKYLIENQTEGYNIYNYVDKPDLSMTDLVNHVGDILKKNIPSIKIPVSLGMMGGYCFDILSAITKKKFPISSVRVKKFCATTQFDASKVASTGFIPPYSLKEGLERTLTYEFLETEKDDITFISE